MGPLEHGACVGLVEAATEQLRAGGFRMEHLRIPYRRFAKSGFKAQVDHLLERGLLIAEGDRYLSLVIRSETRQ